MVSRSTFARTVAVLALGVLLAAEPAGAKTAPCWRAPVVAPVIDPFRAPECRWCPGNRGLEYRTVPGTGVRSVAAGTVSFSGAVAGVDYVVVDAGGGWSITYGALRTRRVAAGAGVAAGEVVGEAGGRLHLGVRRNGRYVDPAPHLGVAVARARLVPIDGRPPRPAPPARLRCASMPAPARPAGVV